MRISDWSSDVCSSDLKQKIVFEAFQQADAGTSRQYGGTGLGLAISREIAGLLGGELRLHSVVGEGSTFTLYLPLSYVGADGAHEARAALAYGKAQQLEPISADPTDAELVTIDDDRDVLVEGEPLLLLVEDDARYATVLRDMARSPAFRVLVANRGSAAPRLLPEYPPSAISPDTLLPAMLGWTVLAITKPDYRNGQA